MVNIIAKLNFTKSKNDILTSVYNKQNFKKSALFLIYNSILRNNHEMVSIVSQA